MSRAIYKYKASTVDGNIVEGIFEGTMEELESLASKKNLLILEFEKEEKKLNQKPFKNEDFLALVEELFYLLNAGISIDQALKMLIKTSSKEQTLAILENTLSEIKAGNRLSLSLTKSLKKENIIVDSLAIGFLKTAEEIGDIPSGLKQLFEYLSFQKKIKKDIKNALNYPLFLLIMSSVVAFLVFFIIVPKFSTIFSPEEFDQLPTLSYWVLSLGTYLDKHSSEFFIIFFTLIFGGFFLMKKVTIPWMQIFYHTPLLSSAILSLQLSIIYGALSTMLKGGLELDRALKEFKKIKLLKELQELLDSTLTDIRGGEKMSRLFSTSSLIPPTDTTLIYVAENSATMPEIFNSLSKRHEENFQVEVKRLLSFLEPTVIVLLGIFIAIIVVSIMMAVMSMTNFAG